MYSVYIEISGGRKPYAETIEFENVPREILFSALTEFRRKVGKPSVINGKSIKGK